MNRIVCLVITMMLQAACLFAQRDAYQQQLEQQLKTTKDTALVNTWLDLGRFFSFQKEDDSAIICFTKAAALAEHCKFPLGVYYGYSNIGIIYFAHYDFEKSMDNFLRSLDVAEQNNLPRYAAVTRANIGLLKSRLGNPAEGLRAMLDVETEMIAMKDTMALVAINSWLSQYYLTLKKTDSAWLFVQKARNYHDAMAAAGVNTLKRRFQLRKNLRYVLFREGNVFMALKQYDKALASLQAAIQNGTQGQKKPEKGIYESLIAKIYFEMNQPEKSMAWTDSALLSLKADSSAAEFAAVYNLRSKLFEKQGRYDLALDAYKNYKLFSSRLDSTKLDSKVHNLQYSYESEKKDREITYLKKERKFSFITIGAASLAALIAFFAFFATRRSKRLKEKLFARSSELLVSEKEREKNSMQLRLLELEQMALRAQMNPHFIFNSLNSIHHYVISSDLEGANRYISMLGSLIRLTLDFSSRRVIRLEEELDYITRYLELEKMRMQEQFAYTIHAAEGVDPGDIFIPPLLLQPFVENAVKHGIRYLKDRQGSIVISISRQHDMIRYSIADNGVGRKVSANYRSSFADTHQSKGTELSRKRIELVEHNGTAPQLLFHDLEDAAGNALGTEVVILLPDDL